MFDIGDVGVDHESNQIQNQIRAFAQDAEGCEAEMLESRIVGRVCTAHSVHHFFAHFDWWGEWLWITSENETEVN